MLARPARIFMCLAVAVTATGAGQTARTREEVLTNKSVISLVTAKLPEDVIIAKIHSSKTRFDLSTDGLVALSGAGVPNTVIRAMMDTASTTTASAAAPTTAAPTASPSRSAAAPVNSDAIHLPTDPGIYMETVGATAGGKTIVQLEPTVYAQGKTGGWLGSALTLGIAKTKFKAVLKNRNAAIRSRDSMPTFYFIFEETNAGLSNNNPYFSSITSPNEFTLLRLDEKKESRETVVSALNAFGGQSGTDTKKTVSFTFAKLRAGAYRVTLDAPLPAGEYCFFSSNAAMGPAMAGTQSANRVFDFSISGSDK